jgi:hypothetical protein
MTGGSPRDPIAITITLLVAICAVTSGACGYMSSYANSRHSSASTQSVKLVSFATTEYLEAVQKIIHDGDLNAQADFLEYQNETELAYLVRGNMVSVQNGYILLNGSGSAKYGYNFTLAWNAFTSDEIAPSADTYNQSVAYALKASSEMTRSQSFLLVTVFMGVSSLLGTAALVSVNVRAKKALIVFIVALLSMSAAFALYTALFA